MSRAERFKSPVMMQEPNGTFKAPRLKRRQKNTLSRAERFKTPVATPRITSLLEPLVWKVEKWGGWVEIRWNQGCKPTGLGPRCQRRAHGWDGTFCGPRLGWKVWTARRPAPGPGSGSKRRAQHWKTLEKGPSKELTKCEPIFALSRERKQITGVLSRVKRDDFQSGWTLTSEQLWSEGRVST